jgi:hypothetical protein
VKLRRRNRVCGLRSNKCGNIGSGWREGNTMGIGRWSEFGKVKDTNIRVDE